MTSAPDLPPFHSVGQGGTWLALDGHDPRLAAALEAADLPAAVPEWLAAATQMVRRKEVGSGIFIGLARYAIGPSEDDDRTVCAALWLEPRRLVGVDHGALPGATAAAGRADGDARLASPWGLLARYLAEMAEDLADDLAALAPMLDELEDRLAAPDDDMPVRELSSLRQRLIRVRRHAVPFGLLGRGLAADRRLAAEPEAHAMLHDVAESVERSLAALGLHLERSEILNDQIQAMLADRMNRATYRLGVVATVFLPLGFLTGLLGINVAGIPGDHDPYAFWLVCGFLVLVAGVWYVAITRGDRL